RRRRVNVDKESRTQPKERGEKNASPPHHSRSKRPAADETGRDRDPHRVRLASEDGGVLESTPATPNDPRVGPSHTSTPGRSFRPRAHLPAQAPPFRLPRTTSIASDQ